MDANEIRAAIAADPALQALVPDTTALAASLSQGRTQTVSAFVGVGRVMDCLGPTEGAAVLDALDGLRAVSSPVKWAWLLLERGELDVGLQSVRSQIDALTPAVFTPAQAAAIKALAERPEIVSEFDVRCAIYADDGSLKV